MNEFHNELIIEIDQKSAVEDISPKNVLFNIYTNYLIESEIIDSDCEFIDFQAPISKNRTSAISGYYYNELEAELDLFIIPDISFEKLTTLEKTTLDKYVNRVKNYFFNLKEIVEKGEESTAGYDLAEQLYNRKRYTNELFYNLEKLKIIVLTDMKKSSNLKKIDVEHQENIKITIDVFDIERIESIKNSKSGKEDLYIDCKEFDEKNDAKGIPYFLASESKEYDSYLCNLNGLFLAKIFNEFGSRLLEGNVRSFLQFKNKVNKGIRETVLNNPKHFFAYNNGLTVTCEEIEIKDNYITKIKNMQIVNGGQTTATLASCLLNDNKNFNIDEKLLDVNVAMKLNIVKDIEHYDDLIADISKYANSQTKVNDIDLMSNHPFHRKMEDLSRKILSPAVNGQQYGTYWFYERANGQYIQSQSKLTKSQKDSFLRENPKNQMIKKQELGKYHCIINQMPHTAVQGSGQSFREFSKWILNVWDKNQVSINEQYFKDMISNIIIFKSVDKIVNKSSWYNNNGYKQQIVSFSISYFYYYISQMNDKVLDFSKIWKNQSLPKELSEFFEELTYLVNDYLQYDDRPVENLKNWVRNEGCWTNLKNNKFKIKTSINDFLISKEEKNTEIKSAKKDEKENKQIDGLIYVYNKVEENELYYELLLNFSKTNLKLSEKEISILTVIAKNKDVLTDAQAKIVCEIIKKAEKEGFTKGNFY